MYTIEKRSASDYRILSEGGDIVGDFLSRAKAERVLELLNPATKGGEYRVELDPRNGGWRVVRGDGDDRQIVVGGLHSEALARYVRRGCDELGGRCQRPGEQPGDDTTVELFTAAEQGLEKTKTAVESEFAGRVPIPYRVVLGCVNSLLSAIQGLAHEVARLGTDGVDVTIQDHTT